ncbi:tetratricopeptide repeat-containing sulfotransferase family protein [Marinicauda salina]|nr:sulfotransferase [Marinicauda salina]
MTDAATQTSPLDALRRARATEHLLKISAECRQLLVDGPPLGNLWAEVADRALEAGDDIAARDAALKLTEAAPEHPQSWLWLAGAHAALGDHAAALAAIEAQLQRHPNDAALHRRAGRAKLDLGQFAGAEASFRRALDIQPFDALSREGLAQARTFTPGDDDLAVMEDARLKLAEAPARDRGVLSYALAKAYEDVGEHEVAARRVAEAAAFYRDSAPFDIVGHEAGVDHMLETYDERFAGANDEAGLVDSRPVFIIAPPAAGASWLSRVLAAEDDVRALERGNGVFWMSAAPLGDQGPEALARALEQGGEENVLAQVGRTYARYVEERFGKIRRWIDPAALNEISGGAIGLSLPAARVVRITRDPRDLAWAILKRRFRRGRHWSYHADDIARVLAAQERLVGRWAQLFPDRILTVRYEDLATDLEDEIRRIAFFTGVDAEAALAEAWLTKALFERDPVGVHERAGSRFEPIEAALGRAGVV